MLSLLALSIALTAGTPTAPCSFGRGQAIPESSTLADQLRCYKSSGRKVNIPGSPFADASDANGLCIVAVANDRVQIAACSFGSDAAITVPFSSISSIGDDPRNDFVTIVVRR